MTFALRKDRCPPVTLNNNHSPQADDVQKTYMVETYIRQEYTKNKVQTSVLDARKEITSVT